MRGRAAAGRGRRRQNFSVDYGMKLTALRYGNAAGTAQGRNLPDLGRKFRGVSPISDPTVRPLTQRVGRFALNVAFTACYLMMFRYFCSTGELLFLST